MDHTTTTRSESNSKSGVIQNLALHFYSAPFCVSVGRLFNLSETDSFSFSKMEVILHMPYGSCEK